MSRPLSPKLKGGAGRVSGVGGGAGAPSPLSPSKGAFSSPGSLALAKMSLAEGLTGYAEGEGSGDDIASGGAGSGASGGAGGGSPGSLLPPVVRHNREVSTARSVLRHSLRGSYNGSVDPLAGTPFLGPGSPVPQPGAKKKATNAGGSQGHGSSLDNSLGTILRSDDSPACAPLHGGAEGSRGPRGPVRGSLLDSFAGVGAAGSSLTSPSRQNSSSSVLLGTQPTRSVAGSRSGTRGRPIPAAKNPKQTAKSTPVSQLDRFRPQETIDEAGGGGGGVGGKKGIVSPGVKGPGWHRERLEQLTDHESGGSLRADDPEDTANKMLGLERELRVRRVRAVKSMKHTDVASAETFLASWLSGR